MKERSHEFYTLPPSIQNLINFIISAKCVNKIVLFGSRARLEARENSDYDFALWVSDRGAWSKTVAEIEEKNLTLLPVDLAIFEELTSEYRQHIEQEGKLIYG